jgi:KaiC/GvpD/RAD55 family RecA-like ATPase
MDYSEVFPGSLELVRGDIPSSSILLVGPPGIGKTIFSKQFLVNGLLLKEGCIYVTTEETTENFFNSLRMYGIDANVTEGMINVVDCYSWRMSGSRSGNKSISELSLISKNLDEVSHSGHSIRFVLDSITGLTTSNTSEDVLRFVQLVTMKLKNLGGRGIFIVDSGAHDEAFLTRLRRIMDGTIEMKSEDTKGEIVRLLRVFSLRGTRHKTLWISYFITDSGIKIDDVDEPRCVLCSKPIMWEPYVEVIDGKSYNFDLKECAETYKKFRAIYGEYFE